MTNYFKEYIDSPSLLAYNKNKVELVDEKNDDLSFLNRNVN